MESPSHFAVSCIFTISLPFCYFLYFSYFPVTIIYPNAIKCKKFVKRQGQLKSKEKQKYKIALFAFLLVICQNAVLAK